MDKKPSGNITFLFTDIEGSTEKWEENTDAMSSSLLTHDQLLQTISNNHNGHIFKTVGDAFCIAFSDVHDAVNCALSIQQNIEKTIWPGPELKIRIALHNGTAEERNSDYFGKTINRIARMVSAGHGGQLLISQKVKELISDELPEGIKVIDLGLKRLKDIKGIEHIYQMQSENNQREFPPLKTLLKERHNLPKFITTFLGRDNEIEEISGHIRNTQLVTLLGPGGLGKTRLSVEISHTLINDYTDGIWFIDLVKISEDECIYTQIIKILDLKNDHLSHSEETVISYLEDKHMVLIFDNCEHIIDNAAESIENIITKCESVTVLTTSREPLNLQHETIYRLQPLPSPGPNEIQKLTLDSLTSYESIRLFIDRAKAVNPSFSIDESEKTALANICSMLDGIPLALELASARTRTFSITDIYNRISENFGFLEVRTRDKHTRQKTLHALIDWSYSLLSETEKKLFTRLSVFHSNWTINEAEIICDSSINITYPTLNYWKQLEAINQLPENKKTAGIQNLETFEKNSKTSEINVLDTMELLTEKSLIEYFDQNGERRYSFLQPIKEFAKIKLTERNELPDYQKRFVNYYSKLSYAKSVKQFYLIDQKEIAGWYSREYANLIHAIDLGLTIEEYANRSILIASSLVNYWSSRFDLKEGVPVYNRIFNEAKISPNVAEWSNFFLSAAWILCSANLFDLAMFYMTEYKKRGFTPQNIIEELNYSLNMSLSYYHIDLDKAYSYIENIWNKTVAQKKNTISKSSQLTLQFCKASIRFLQGREQESRPILIDLVTSFNENLSHLNKMHALSDLAIIELILGNYESSIKMAVQSIEVCKQYKNTEIVKNLNTLGSAKRCLQNKTCEDRTCSESLFYEALKYADEYEDTIHISFSYTCLAALKIDTDCFEEAVEYLQLALDHVSLTDFWNKRDLKATLIYCAHILNRNKRFTATAQIYGVIDLSNPELTPNLPECEQHLKTDLMDEARQQLGSEAFDTSVAIGREQGLEKVINMLKNELKHSILEKAAK